jgi:hypothetical protein
MPSMPTTASGARSTSSRPAISMPSTPTRARISSVLMTATAVGAVITSARPRPTTIIMKMKQGASAAMHATERKTPPRTRDAPLDSLTVSARWVAATPAAARSASARSPSPASTASTAPSFQRRKTSPGSSIHPSWSSASARRVTRRPDATTIWSPSTLTSPRKRELPRRLAAATPIAEPVIAIIPSRMPRPRTPESRGTANAATSAVSTLLTARLAHAPRRTRSPRIHPTRRLSTRMAPPSTPAME